MAAKQKKVKKARPFESLMLILLPGKVVKKDEIATLLGWTAPRGADVKGPKIYNVSSYIWDIKNLAHVKGETIIVKSIREGKAVTGYQIVNTDVARKYLEGRGLLQPKKKKVGAEGPLDANAPDVSGIPAEVPHVKQIVVPLIQPEVVSA